MNGKYSANSLVNAKSFNKHAILDLIRFTSGGISRAELARKMGLSRSAVTSIVNDLLSIQIIRETQSATTTSGRRPIILEIEPRHGYVVGADIGVTHLSLILADLSAAVVSELEIPFDISRGPSTCLEEVDQQVQVLLRKAGLGLENILSFGVGVPGPIAGDGGIVISPPIMPGWDMYPIRTDLINRWDCPVSLNNDAELGALGEWAYGAGRGENNLIYVKVGSGVGAGLLFYNHIYRGTTGTAGEIGHMTIENDGPVCTCGNRGCLEVLAGGRAIAQQARRAVRSRQRTQLTKIEPLDQITARDVAVAAGRGDLIAQQILSEAGDYLGTAIAGLINLLNPGIVVIGGGVAQAGDLLLEPIRKAVYTRTLKAASQSVRITSAVLGYHATSMGAVIQALSVYLHQLVE